MAEERVQRKLAAILAADVVGYSRLMGVDEEGTLARLKAHRAELIEPTLAAHGGRLVKLTGDGALAEFASVVDAVRCAVEIQNGMAQRNIAEPKESRIRFRIGVNLGDIIVDGEDIYGDGVNVAARLEGLSEPDSVVVSAKVHEEVAERLDLAFDDLGEQAVKNIARPVRAFRVVPGSRPVQAAAPASTQRPSIAVLPFDNLSGDPAQDFIGDGLTEDVITALSAIRTFFVISRNSTFHYKGTSPDVRRVSSELGVRYVVEGSVRRAGQRLRMNAQLIDGRTGQHLWAERYDRNFAELFEVQDDMTRTIVAHLEPALSRAEYERGKSAPTEHLDAWELFHRGMTIIHGLTTADLAEARRLFEAAAERDPSFAGAFAGVAWTYAEERTFGTGTFDFERAIRAARHAVSLDERDAFAHFVLGWVYHRDKQTGPAITAAETAIRLNPSLAMAHVLLAGAFIHGGRPEDGIPHMELAIRLGPNEQNLGLYYSRLAAGHLYLGAYDKAVAAGRQAVQYTEAWMTWMILTAALGHAGPDEEARRAAAHLATVQPRICTGFVRTRYVTVHKPSMDHLIEGLRKAGVPE